MKRILAVSAAIAVIASFAGCSDKKSGNSSSQEVTTAAASEAETTTEEQTTEAKTTEAVTTTASEEDTTAANVDIENREEYYKDLAAELMDAMTVSEKLGSGLIQVDANQPLASDPKYFKVTNGKIDTYDFSDLDAVKAFLSDNFTGDFYNEHTYLIEGDSPFFTEGDDGLYAQLGGRAFIYGWNSYETEIISASDDEFTARAEYELTGGLTQVDIHIIKNGYKWLVDRADSTPLN